MDTPFIRSPGTGAGFVSIPDGVSGFNGGVANGVVNLGNGAALTWGDPTFNPSIFVLNSASAMFPINFTNAINLGSTVRKVQVEHPSRVATMSGNLTGSSGSGLEKLGAGTLVLSGNNSYSGVTRVLGGGLTLGSANALPGGIDVNGGGSPLVLSGVLLLGSSDFKRGLGTDTNQVQWGPVSGGFAATNADRIVNLGGSSDPVTWDIGGFVSNGCALMLGSISGNKTVDFQNPINLGSGSAKTVQVDQGSAVIDGVLSGVITGGSLVKSGSGTLFLSAVNSYEGPTVLNGGVLLVTNLADGGTSSGIGASDNSITNLKAQTASTLRYGGGTAEIDRNFTITAGVALTIDVTNALTTLTLNGTNSVNAGVLTKTGAGTLKLNAALNHTGLTSITGGRLQYGIDNALSSGGLTVNGAGAVLDMGSYTDAVGIVTLTAGSILGDGTLASSGNFIFNSAGAVTCSVVMAGAGIFTNSAAGVKSIQNVANTFSGKVFMNGGAVEIVKLANVNEASSLGQPGSAASGVVSLGSVAVAGILQDLAHQTDSGLAHGLKVFESAGAKFTGHHHALVGQQGLAGHPGVRVKG
jgi:autotransporter-associated beta strand protein